VALRFTEIAAVEMKVALLRVGIDSGCGGMQGPLFRDGTFEFIPIPDDKHRVDRRTYGNTIGRHERALVEYFPPPVRSRMADFPMHVDPEFETFTYGDPTPPKKSLARLAHGDMLVFYAGLEGWDFESAPALYIVGYFEVQLADVGSSFSRSTLRESFGGNFHVMHEDVFAGEREKVILIKGSSRSRLLTKAAKLGERQRLPTGSWWQLISPSMAGIFGRFGGIGSLQRSTPRWVEPRFSESATKFVRTLT
jgi:hypothetical protein